MDSLYEPGMRDAIGRLSDEELKWRLNLEMVKMVYPYVHVVVPSISYLVSEEQKIWDTCAEWQYREYCVPMMNEEAEKRYFNISKLKNIPEGVKIQYGPNDFLEIFKRHVSNKKRKCFSNCYLSSEERYGEDIDIPWWVMDVWGVNKTAVKFYR